MSIITEDFEAGVGFGFIGTDKHPYRTGRKLTKVDGEWVAVEATEESTTTLISKPWFQNKRPVVAIKEYKETTSAEREAGRVRSISNTKAGTRLMDKARKPITTRQKIGDPNCRLSEGEDFPLMETLRRDNLDHYIKLVKDYRALVALCEAEPLKGLDYSKADVGGVVRESVALTPEKDIQDAANDNWKSMPDGEIQYSNKLKKSKGAYSIPSGRKGIAAINDNGEPSVPKTESLHVKLTDEILIKQIDSKPILAELRIALGPLLDAFDDATLGGRTMKTIGESNGFHGRSAYDAGKALVMRAMSGLQGAWHDISVRERKLEDIANKNWNKRRNLTAANDNNYLANVA